MMKGEEIVVRNLDAWISEFGGTASKLTVCEVIIDTDSWGGEGLVMWRPRNWDTSIMTGFIYMDHEVMADAVKWSREEEFEPWHKYLLNDR